MSGDVVVGVIVTFSVCVVLCASNTYVHLNLKTNYIFHLIFMHYRTTHSSVVNCSLKFFVNELYIVHLRKRKFVNELCIVHLRKPKFVNELHSSLNVHYRTIHSSVVNYFVWIWNRTMHSSLKKPKFKNELRSSLNVHHRTTHSSVVNYFVLKTEICNRTMRSSLNRTTHSSVKGNYAK